MDGDPFQPVAFLFQFDDRRYSIIYIQSPCWPKSMTHEEKLMLSPGSRVTLTMWPDKSDATFILSGQ